MNDNIKEIKISLANGEGIMIPYECFKKLSINGSTNLSLLKNKDEVINMECDILDNGDIDYSSTHQFNAIYPLARLSEDNNITHVDIIYEDDTETNLFIQWYEEDNPYCDRNDNANQIIEKVNYNEIHIELKPFIRKYSIQEVFELEIFNLEVGRIIYGNENKQYLLMETETNKYLDAQTLSAELVNMKFTLLPIQL